MEGLRITRRFTNAGRDPYETIEWSLRDSRITNPDGSVVIQPSKRSSADALVLVMDSARQVDIDINISLAPPTD